MSALLAGRTRLGCLSSQATAAAAVAPSAPPRAKRPLAAAAARRVKGKPVDDVLTIKNSDIAKHLSLPPVKLHCSMLAEDAIKAAVHDWKVKQAKTAQAAV